MSNARSIDKKEKRKYRLKIRPFYVAIPYPFIIASSFLTSPLIIDHYIVSLGQYR